MASPIPITPAQATTGISLSLRNNIYSALLSGPGIRNIEATLDESLRSTGFRDNLKTYITYLFRSGQATTAEEAYRLAMERIKEDMAEQHGGSHGTGENGNSNGNGSVNGSGDGGEVGEGPEVDLKVPKEVVSRGTKIVMRELEKVCEISYEEEN
ncbi:hypothetical protein T440DRAFT_394556 [Plenodomus tracheiphilus IPT5]|uniref:Uncharacterized protein n=1 Tax=Plenodomus tracheiphilus IPT5 TaxID=1408161 RepID=A0A6A7BAQ1_9PLEO|nr:hypothetical protein T440DRAFT_394556 [Plenodomus tracheiphilus IPT5]